MRGPLTFICAPAGSGKTSLAASWLATNSIRSAWVSLDVLDRDPRRFWTSVINALQQVIAGVGQGALAKLQVTGPPLTDAVDALIDELARTQTQPTALVIDDLHLVVDVGRRLTLDRFIERMPAWLRLVFVSAARAANGGKQSRRSRSGCRSTSPT